MTKPPKELRKVVRDVRRALREVKRRHDDLFICMYCAGDCDGPDLLVDGNYFCSDACLEADRAEGGP